MRDAILAGEAETRASAHLGLLYYFFPAGTTNLSVGYVSSTNGGSTWSAPTQLAGPMTMSWAAATMSPPNKAGRAIDSGRQEPRCAAELFA